VASKSTLGRACTECDGTCTREEAVRQDYLARTRAFMAGCQRSFDYNQILEES
jgi:hypothetical protein